MSSILRSHSQALGASRAARPVADTDVEALFELSSQALICFDERGQVQRANAPMRALAGRPPEQLEQLAPVLQELLGWPGSLPATTPREIDGFLDRPDGQRHRLRVQVRSLAAVDGLRRWVARFEDCSIEDDRALANLEIAALTGDAEVGLASWDAARGWVQRALPTAQRQGGSARAGSGGGGALTSVSKDLVEPGSLPEYDRLQRALRQRERVEVRYAVQHPQTGQRWLMSRVEPGELGPGRPAFSVMTLDVSQEEGARRRNAQLLRELTAILDENPAGIAYFIGPGLVRCNRLFEQLLGLTEGAGRGCTLGELLMRAGVDTMTVDHVLATLLREDRCETEFRREAESGSSRWYTLALRRSGEVGRGADETVAVLTDVTELHRNEAELAALARERELMFSLSDVGIVYQRDGRIERANQAMEQLTGLDQASLQGLPVSELFADESDYLAHSATERRDLAALGRHSSERQLRRRDGSTLWVLSSQRLVDAGNPRAGSICSFVSVDERRRAREQVLLQADRTRAVLDSVLVGIVTVDDQGIEWMNRSARRMFGGELADFVGQQIAVVATADPEHPLRRTDWLSTLEEGQAETFDCRLKARDGREFWVVGNVVVTGRELPQRQLTFALMDIDSRRRAEGQVARARASLQRIIETAPMAIALLDAGDHRVQQLNQMMAEFAGWPIARLQDQAPASWLDTESAAALGADLSQATRTHVGVHREYAQPASPGRPERVWDLRILPLEARGDEAPEQLLLVAADVTEQRAADQARLEAAIAQREMLVKEVHHRIKNNLQGVAGLLQQNAQRHPEAAAAIAEAVSQVHAIAQVHGLQVGISGPLRVRNVVEAICGSVQRMFGCQIQVAVEGPAPHRFALTEADSIPIALTVNELLTNAIKHSGGGVVSCSLVVGEQQVAIGVANAGRLPTGFQLSAVPTGISGLGLVRALLPRKGAAMALEQRGDEVLATLRLQPPAVTVLAPL